MKFLTSGILSLLLLLSFSINAQTVKGILTDENEKTPLAGATVKLNNRPDSLNTDSSTAYTTVSNKDGLFVFENVTPKKYYRLVVESVGLGAFQMTIYVRDTADSDLGIIP